MKVSKFVMAAVVAAAIAATGSQARAAITLPNLPAGSQYELVFLTADTITATSPDIGVYNTFVTTEAAQNPSLPQGVAWHAIVSTYDGTTANVNAPSTPSIPVYSTLGELVADSSYPLYSSSGYIVPSSNFGINSDQFGTLSHFLGVWTGSNSDGSASIPLGTPGPGSTYVTAGSPGGTGGWLVGGKDIKSDSDQVYALSSPITVPAPEPTSLCLLGLGAIGLLARRRRIA